MLLQGTVERFFRYVNKTESCWLWVGSTQKRTKERSYGTFSYRYKQYRAHRFSWIIHNGPILDGLWVLHTCDNGVCVNPDHLWLGTSQDNIDDKTRKGRASGSIRLGTTPKYPDRTRLFARSLQLTSGQTWRIIKRADHFIDRKVVWADSDSVGYVDTKTQLPGRYKAIVTVELEKVMTIKLFAGWIDRNKARLI